jgi:hypothetical protein
VTVFFIDIIINLLRPFRTSLKKLEIETPTDGKNVPVSNKNILEGKGNTCDDDNDDGMDDL